MRISEIAKDRSPLDLNMRTQYLNAPVSVKFYNLMEATGKSVIGNKYPQVDYIDSDQAYKLDGLNFPKENLNFSRIELYKTSKLSDIISCGAFSGPVLLLSNKAADVFSLFNLGNHQWYPATVYFKDKKYEYRVLYYLNDMMQELDYKTSLFYTADYRDIIVDKIELSDFNDYTEKWKKIYFSDSNAKLIYTNFCKFKEGTILPDLFNLQCSPVKYISSKLSQAILDNNLSGFEFEKIYGLND